MRRSKLFLAVVTLVVLSANAKAASLYVATSGNDANPGTLAAPFRTLGKAASMAKPGDVVNVRGGVYNGAVSISSRGTAAARITFRSNPGEKAIIDGTGLSSSTILLNLYKTEYVDLVGFEIRNAPFIAVNARTTKFTRIADNEIHHAVRNAIYVGSDVMGTSTDITVEGNVLHDCVLENQYHNMNGGWAGTLVVSRTNRGVIRNNRIYNNDGEAIIGLLSDNLTITGNVTSDNFSQGVFLDNAQNTLVDGNFIYSTGNTRYYRDGFPGQGIAVANESYSETNPSTDNTITNNIVVGTRWGFYYGAFENGGGLKNTRIANNTFHKTAQELIRISNDTHANSVVENNVFSIGSAGSSVAGGGVTFRNNTWHGVTAGAAAGPGDAIGDPRFVRAGGYSASDYKLSAGSIAIARAADLSSVVKTDFFGNPRVSPFDMGAHQFSLAGSAASDTVAPTVPGSLRRATAATGLPVLVWNASTDNVAVTGYSVLRDGVAVATVTVPTWSETAAGEGLLHSYQVIAIDAAGNRSAGSNVLQLSWTSTPSTTPEPTPEPTPAPAEDTQAPQAVTDLRTGTISATSISLRWSPAIDNDGIKSYKVYRNGEHVATVLGNAFTDTGLESSRSYSYYVIATDLSGNLSGRSNTATATTEKVSVGKSRSTRH